jgi:hypothetical protein
MARPWVNERCASAKLPAAPMVPLPDQNATVLAAQAGRADVASDGVESDLARALEPTSSSSSSNSSTTSPASAPDSPR